MKGLKPQRIAKGRHVIIKSDTPIEEVKVKALHPCLSEDGYTRVCQTTTWSKQPGTLTVCYLTLTCSATYSLISQFRFQTSAYSLIS